MAIKIHSRRQEAQLDLNQKRELLEQLVDRLDDFKNVGAFSSVVAQRLT